MIVDNTRKDDLLTRMVSLEKTLEELRSKREEKLPEARKAEKIRVDFKAIYEAAREQYEKADQEANRKRRELRLIEADGKDAKDELARLTREYNRLRDAEAINLKYQEQVEAFKAKCLEAPWRKENRTDGLGALEYQIDGAIHLALAREALLGDKRGLGKTLTALITCDLLEARKIIAIVPADIVENFIREVNKWTPHRSPLSLYGMNKNQRNFILRAIKQAPEFLLVVNYEAGRDSDLIPDLAALQADTLLCDEAHKGKSIRSLQGKSLQKIRYSTNTCPQCMLTDVKYNGLEKPDEIYTCWCGHEGPITDFCSIKNVIPMSGTFILNRPQELYPMLRLVDLKNFHSEKDYLRDFCRKTGPSTWKWNYNGEKELLKKIGPRYLARDRSTAGIVIPPPEPVEHIIPMKELENLYPSQHEAYKQIREFMEIAFTDDATMKMPEVIVRLMRMRQVLVWPAAIEFAERDKQGLVKRRLSLDVHESWKIDKAEELIKELNEEGERVVVFSQFKAGLHELQRRLGVRTAIYDGSSTREQRDRISIDFDASTNSRNSRWDNVVCSYKTAGEGLNFNSASHMILIDREWNPGRESQAIGRMDRLGQTKDTYVHHLVVGGSVDSWMADLIHRKADMIGGFEDEAAAWKLALEAMRNGDM